MTQKLPWRDFVAVTFSVALLGLGLGSTLPLTALALTARGHGPDVVGWITAATALGGVLGTFTAPMATLRWGRRKVMLGCLVLASAAVLPLQYMDALAGWFALRFVFGLAMAPLFVLGESWINTLASDAIRGRVVATYTTSFTACQVLGPLLTDGLSHFPGSAFLVCGSIFLLGAPGVMLARDPQAASPADAASTGSPTKESGTSWLGILRRAPVIIAGTAFFAAFDNIVLSFLPLFALDAGFSQSRALAAASIVLAGDAALQFGIGWLADHYGRARMHRLCGLAVCVMLPLLPLVVHLPIAWELYLFLLGGAAGAIYTLSMVASGQIFSGASLLRAAGLIGLTWNLSSSTAPAATGLAMAHFGPAAMVAVLWLLALGFVLVARKA
ncbi:MFS transporter [Rhodoferax sp.]|uniref:MFS transporter n=1 Tax=Rhodoferax sp. TaxID=50421 RepID=UPI00374DB2FE